MKAKITLSATKEYVMDYPDNDFSDEVLESNFWLYEFGQNEFIDSSKFKLKRTDIKEKGE